MKKLIIQLEVMLDVELENDVNIDEVINEMDYNFTSLTENAKITNTEIRDFEIKGTLNLLKSGF